MGCSVAPSPPPSLLLGKRNSKHDPPLSLSLSFLYIPLSLSHTIDHHDLDPNLYPMYMFHLLLDLSIHLPHPIRIYLYIYLHLYLLSYLSRICYVYLSPHPHPYISPSPSSPHLSIVCHHVMSLCLCHTVILICQYVIVSICHDNLS